MASLGGNRWNFSYYTVPLAWMICLAPHVWSVKYNDAITKQKKFDKVNPRTFLHGLAEDQSVSEEAKGMIARAQAAQLNGYENLGFFAASVVAANTAGVDYRLVNLLSGAYLINRISFNIAYILGVAGEVRGIFFYAALG